MATEAAKEEKVVRAQLIRGTLQFAGDKAHTQTRFCWCNPRVVVLCFRCGNRPGERENCMTCLHSGVVPEMPHIDKNESRFILHNCDDAPGATDHADASASQEASETVPQEVQETTEA